MKKILIALMFVLIASVGWSADTKISDLTTAPGGFQSDSDFVPMVRNTGGSNLNYKTVITTSGTQASLHVDDILTALGIASEATHFGTFTGTTIPDSSTGKAALQALETSLELKAPLTSPAFVTDIHAATAGGATAGTALLPFSSVFIGNAATNNIQLTGTAASAKVITLPGQTGTVTVGPTSTTAGQAWVATAVAGIGAWTSSFTGTLGGLTASKDVASDGSGNLVSVTWLTSGTSGQTYTFPTTSATLARTDAGNTFTGVNAFTAPTVTTSIAPAAADGATLGTANYEFSDLYLANGGVIYFQNDQSVYLTPSASTLTLTGNFVATGDISTVGKVHGGIEPVYAGLVATHAVTTAQCYGTILYATTATTFNLPAGVVGMNVGFKSKATNVFRVNPDNADKIDLNGTVGAAGVDIYSAGAKGNFIILFFNTTNTWDTMGTSGVVTAGS